jgi:hypothetical protein
MTVMRKLKPAMLSHQVVTTMVKLARCANLDRIILSGSAAPQLMLELHRRGYFRIATTATCGLPHGQYDIALVEWQRRSMKALETALNWLVHFIGRAGVLVIWIYVEEASSQRTLRSILERLGFQIEAETRCGDGVAILACRLEASVQPSLPEHAATVS